MTNVNCICAVCGSHFQLSYELPLGSAADVPTVDLCDDCEADGYVTAAEFYASETPSCSPAGEPC